MPNNSCLDIHMNSKSSQGSNIRWKFSSLVPNVISPAVSSGKLNRLNCIEIVFRNQVLKFWKCFDVNWEMLMMQSLRALKVSLALVRIHLFLKNSFLLLFARHPVSIVLKMLSEPLLCRKMIIHDFFIFLFADRYEYDVLLNFSNILET